MESRLATKKEKITFVGKYAKKLGAKLIDVIYRHKFKLNELKRLEQILEKR
jgi:hypothetical protein